MCGSQAPSISKSETVGAGPGRAREQMRRESGVSARVMAGILESLCLIFERKLRNVDRSIPRDPVNDMSCLVHEHRRERIRSGPVDICDAGRGELKVRKGRSETDWAAKRRLGGDTKPIGAN